MKKLLLRIFRGISFFKWEGFIFFAGFSWHLFYFSLGFKHFFQGVLGALTFLFFLQKETGAPVFKTKKHLIFFLLASKNFFFFFYGGACLVYLGGPEITFVLKKCRFLINWV